jgi:hypothetical protein
MSYPLEVFEPIGSEFYDQRVYYMLKRDTGLKYSSMTFNVLAFISMFVFLLKNMKKLAREVKFPNCG